MNTHKYWSESLIVLRNYYNCVTLVPAKGGSSCLLQTSVLSSYEALLSCNTPRTENIFLLLAASVNRILIVTLINSLITIKGCMVDLLPASTLLSLSLFLSFLFCPQDIIYHAYTVWTVSYCVQLKAFLSRIMNKLIREYKPHG